MSPSVVYNDLHFVDEAKWSRFLATFRFLRPLANAPANLQLLEKRGGEPSGDSVLPQTREDLRQRKPASRRMHRIVRLSGISHPDVGVEEDTPGARCRIVSMDKTALGALQVVFGQSVVDTPKLEAFDPSKDRRVHCCNPVPTAGHWHGSTAEHRFPRVGGSEVRPGLGRVFMAARISQGKGVVEARRLAKVERACCGVLSVVGV